MPKIFWNASEKELLAKEMNKLVDEGRYTTLLDAFRTIQFALPANRRRPLTTTSGVACAEVRKLAEKLRKAEEKQSKHHSSAPVVQPEPQVTPQPVVDSDDRQMVDLTVCFRSMAQDMASALEVFLVAEFEKVAERAFINAAQSVKRRTTALTKVAQQMANRQRVLIVGLLPQQAREIEADFSDLINLSFVGSDENKDRLQNKLANVDVVVVMTKFVSHSHSDIVKKHSNVVNINGGLTSLKDHLLHAVCN